MKLVYICQAVDEKDPFHASIVTWLRTLAGKPGIERLFVITLRQGTFALPPKVEIRTIEGRSRLERLLSFYRCVAHAMRSGIDCFFIQQGGPYPVLLLPLKLLTRKPIFQWKAHPHVGGLMKFYARFCDDIVFTSTPGAFPFALPNVRVIGQGLDTRRFQRITVPRDRDMVTVGRVSAAKGLEQMIRSLASLNHRYGLSLTLDVYGSTFSGDEAYLESLGKLAEELGSAGSVVFRGPVDQGRLPGILNRYRLFLSFSETALDRAVTEAMGCGLTVVSTNPCFAEILPAELRDLLVIPRADIDRQTDFIHGVFSMSDEQLEVIGDRLREIVVRDHSIETLFDKVVAEIEGRLH